MKKSKKALSAIMIIGLAISLITLLTLLFFQSGVLDNAKYESSILGCQKFFEGINGKAPYWEKLKSPTNFLIKTISEFCISKDVSITKSSVTNSANLVLDCYKKTGSGIDIMASESYGKNVCLFCGFIKSENDIDNFDEKFSKKIVEEKYKKLFQESQTKNLNKETLSKKLLPKKISNNNRIAVIYFSYKPNHKSKKDTSSPFIDVKLQEISSQSCQFFSGFGSTWNVLSSYACSSDVQTTTGIALTNWKYDTNKINFKDEGKLVVNSKDVNLNIGCNELIIPKENI